MSSVCVSAYQPTHKTPMVVPKAINREVCLRLRNSKTNSLLDLQHGLLISGHVDDAALENNKEQIIRISEYD